MYSKLFTVFILGRLVAVENVLGRQQSTTFAIPRQVTMTDFCVQFTHCLLSSILPIIFRIYVSSNLFNYVVLSHE